MQYFCVGLLQKKITQKSKVFVRNVTKYVVRYVNAFAKDCIYCLSTLNGLCRFYLLQCMVILTLNQSIHIDTQTKTAFSYVRVNRPIPVRRPCKEIKGSSVAENNYSLYFCFLWSKLTNKLPPIPQKWRQIQNSYLKKGLNYYFVFIYEKNLPFDLVLYISLFSLHLSLFPKYLTFLSSTSVEPMLFIYAFFFNLYWCWLYCPHFLNWFVVFLLQKTKA